MSIPISQVSPFPLAEDRVVLITEASVISSLSVPTLKRCHQRGELKIIKLPPRRIGVRLSDLKTFLDSRAA
jgi:hypothetical protein